MYKSHYWRSGLIISLSLLISCGTGLSSAGGEMESPNRFSEDRTSINLQTKTNPQTATCGLEVTKRPVHTIQTLKILAECTTVRIFSLKDEIPTGGSGVLIDRQDSKYIVLTNQHVVAEHDRLYSIQTPDGQKYEAKILAAQVCQNPEDVCFLSFDSPHQGYPVLTFPTTARVVPNDRVFAGGFPFIEKLSQSLEFNFTEGTVVRVLERPFLGGYQVGYTNLITPGMSGGPVLNQHGELIGINGLRSNPLFSNSYIYEDGTPIAQEELELVSQLSWAVPLKTAIELFETIPEPLEASEPQSHVDYPSDSELAKPQPVPDEDFPPEPTLDDW